jgi:hypothetical protein
VLFQMRFSRDKGDDCLSDFLGERGGRVADSPCGLVPRTKLTDRMLVCSSLGVIRPTIFLPIPPAYSRRFG